MVCGTRPFDFSRIEDDPRGLTGTDNSFLGYAKAMAARGHDVTIFASKQREKTEWCGVSVRPYEDRRAVTREWDAALSWCDIAGLADVNPNVLRVVDCQCNNFEYTRRDEHDAIDLYLAPSAPLARRLAADPLVGRAPWQVAPNGCNPADYDLSAKVPGRCIFASSSDRGLHVALEQWERIRSAVPDATLKIFYHSLQKWIEQIPENARQTHWSNQEHVRRATICRDLLPKLAPLGVTYCGSKSRRELAREYSAAVCLTGPTDTVSRGSDGYTEGFGVAVLEGCAAGAVPCISSVDAFGEIYAGVCPMVQVPPTCLRFAGPDNALAKEWSDNVIRVLTNEAYRQEWTAKGLAFARQHAWPVLAERLEQILVEAKARKAAA